MSHYNKEVIEAYNSYMSIIDKYNGMEDKPNARRQLNKYANILRKICDKQGLNFMGVCTSLNKTFI